MRPTVRDQLWIVIATGVIVFSSLGAPRLWDVDEPRNAVCAREMLQSGDWIVPTFNGELRAHKPALLYWHIMLAYQVFGVTEFAARFCSAAAAVGTALLTYYLGRMLFCARVGFWAALILATSPSFVVLARAATPDSIFIFWLTLAVTLCVRSSIPPSSNGSEIVAKWRLPQGPFLTAAYFALGVAVLAKGPVALVLGFAGMLSWVIAPLRSLLRTADEPSGTPAESEKSASRFAHRVAGLLRLLPAALTALKPLRAGIVVSLVVLPWYTAVAVRTDGAWTHEFFLTHNLGRFLDPMESHRGPVFYYLVAICIGMFPWSLLVAPCLIALRRRVREQHPWQAGYLAVACWTALYIGFFSLAQTKLPSYVVPAYPALALMTACFVHSLLTELTLASAFWLRVASRWLVGVGVTLAPALAVIAHVYLGGDLKLGLLGLIPLAGGIACLTMLRRQHAGQAATAFAVTAYAFVLTTFTFGLMRVDGHQNSAEIVQLIRASGGSKVNIAGFRYFKPSWVFYANERVDRLQHMQQVREFFRDAPKPYLITPESEYRRIAPFLPREVVPLATVPKFLGRGELIVLARGPDSPAPMTASRHRKANHR